MLIQNAKILDMTGAAPYVGDILIRDGRIVQIGTSLQEMPEEETIDASGLWLCQDLWMHTLIRAVLI